MNFRVLSPIPIAFLILALSLCFGCGASDKGKAGLPKPPDPAVLEATALIINGATVPEKQILQTMSSISRRSLALLGDLPPSQKSQLRDLAEERIIRRELLRQYAAKAKILGDAETVESRYRDILKRLPPGSTESEIPAILGTDVEDLKSELMTDTIVDNILDSFKEKITISDETLRSHYEANPDRYKTPEKVSVSYIFLQFPENATDEQIEKVGARAVEIADRAQPGDAALFARLADRSSDDPSVAFNHGDLGFTSTDNLLPELASVAIKLKEGQVSAPVKTLSGYYILRLQGVQPAMRRSFEEIRQELESRLISERAQEKLTGLGRELMEQARIERKVPGAKIAREGAAVEEKEAPAAK